MLEDIDLPSARSILDNPTAKAKPHKVFKRGGVPTTAEKQFVAQLVQDQPAEMTVSQVNSLAKTLRRSREVVKGMVEAARENFVSTAERYVQIHAAATEAALENGDAKSLDVAAKASQWAMENIAAEGVRIVDKAVEKQSGSRIMIGIALGGVNNPTTTVPIVSTKVEDV